MFSYKPCDIEDEVKDEERERDKGLNGYKRSILWTINLYFHSNNFK